MARDIRETEIASRIPVGELFVIDTEQMQDGGMQVMDVHLVLLREIAVVIGGAIGEALLYAAVKSIYLRSNTEPCSLSPTLR